MSFKPIRGPFLWYFLAIEATSRKPIFLLPLLFDNVIKVNSRLTSKKDDFVTDFGTIFWFFVGQMLHVLSASFLNKVLKV